MVMHAGHLSGVLHAKALDVQFVLREWLEVEQVKGHDVQLNEPQQLLHNIRANFNHDNHTINSFRLKETVISTCIHKQAL